MNTKFQLELLRTLRQRRGLAKGFTLIELLIVVAIIGILAAIGIPKYLDIRNNASASAKIGEVVGLAKECAVFVGSGGYGTAPASGISGDPSPCSATADNVFTRTFDREVSNLECLDQTANNSLGFQITVTTLGQISCSFT